MPLESHFVVIVSGENPLAVIFNCSYISKKSCKYEERWTVIKGSAFRFVFQLKMKDRY